MFDALLQVTGASVIDSQDHLELAFVLGIMIPIGTEGGMPVPAGQIRIPLGKKSAIEFANGVLEVADKLPDPPEVKDSGIILANSMQGVEQAAQQDQKLRNGR